jgi:hypothetical protein
VTKYAPPCQPTTRTNKAEIELTAEELERVVGGKGKTSQPQIDYLKYEMSDIIISSYGH